MNEFLQYLENVYRENNVTDYNVFYSLLINSSIPRESIEPNFAQWISDYSARRDEINVFRSDDWRYFCQFVHPDGRECSDEKMIKLYLSFEAPYMYKAVKFIFDYLCKEKIIHVSKVGKNTRNDSIVIRVNNLDDARKIIQFVNRNFFLKKHLRPANPFVYKENGVGMAIDGNKSYNSELAKLLFQYCRFRERQRIQTPPNSMEFRNFVLLNYNNANDHSLRNIYKLIMANLDGRTNKDIFDDIVNEYQDAEYMVFAAIKAIYLKYGKEYTILALKRALKGDCSLFYGLDSLSFQIKICLSSSSIRRIIIHNLGYNNNASIGTKETMLFISNVLSSYLYNNDEKINILIEALKTTIKKQGIVDVNKLASVVLFDFIYNKKYEVFTRQNGLRRTMMLSLIPEEINEIINLLRARYQNFHDTDYSVVLNFILQEVISQNKML